MLKTVNYKEELAEDLVLNKDSLDPQRIIEEIHSRLGHNVVLVHSSIDPNGVGAVVEWPGKGKVIVIILLNDEKITHKHISKASKAKALFNCELAIIYSSLEDLSKELYKQAKEEKIELVDFEDLKRLSRQVDAKQAALKKDETI